MSLKFLLEARLTSESFDTLHKTLWGFGFKSYDPKSRKLVINLIIKKLIILLDLGHNFWTRNARKLIKVSGTSCEKWPKAHLTYDVTHKKAKPKIKKIFLIAGLKTYES